ncbi:hypothetical protein ACIRPQ_20775 [Streptomyces sp. NPDC101213]|uniref:hypothetical protein n=1 Tax=Streptomyces sp. NPDC101213 TaxID=3366130 RepID=UPI00381AF507
MGRAPRPAVGGVAPVGPPGPSRHRDRPDRARAPVPPYRRIVGYRAPDGIRGVQVFPLVEDSPSASVAAARATASELDGHREIHVRDVPDPSGNEAAEHECTAEELSGEPAAGSAHPVVDHRSEAVDEERHTLIAYGARDDGTEDGRELLDTARAWFRPPPAQGPAPEPS